MFTQDGNIILERNLYDEYIKFPIYDLIPIKTKKNDLYYIVLLNSIHNFVINLFYYKINIEGNGLNYITNKEYNLSNFIKSNDSYSFIVDISCQLMNNYTYDNILVCFYISQYPSKVHVTSFNIDNDLNPFMNLYIYKEEEINHIKSKCNEDKSKAFICFYKYSSSIYCSIYDLNTNNLSFPQKIINNVGIYISDLEIYFFRKTEQYILLTKGSDDILRIIIFDINFHLIHNQEIKYENNYLSNKEIIIYLPQYNQYSIISDIFFNGKYIKKNFITNITLDEINNKNKAYNNLRILDSELSPNNKCLYANDSSLELNLCIECNKDGGYYPVNYNNKNILTNGYKECFNEQTKPINFYFNREKEEYSPCYETCRTCDYYGNATINNCTTCDFSSIFRPGLGNTTNCIKECRYRYYITPYGQYKCTKDNECNINANFYIKEKNKCTNNCSLDDTYIYQYNGECLNECPDNTEPINNICVGINKEICSIDINEYNLENNLTTDNLDIIAKTYSNEYIYTENHISLFKHDLYLITLYKNKDCINNLKLQIPIIDFGKCYKTIQDEYNIKNNLIVLIIEKYYNGQSNTLYFFYDPYNGRKLDAVNLCKDDTIMIEENIISILNSTDINITKILKLAEQNINLFNKSNDFYNDICFHFESPNGRDITLRDRLLEYYPNITLCNEGCFLDGVNLTSMKALCKCTFTEILSGNLLLENAFVSKLSNEIKELISMSNFEVLKCYKDIFNYTYFKKNNWRIYNFRSYFYTNCMYYYFPLS